MTLLKTSLSAVHGEGYVHSLKFTTTPATTDGQDAPYITVYMNSNKRTLFAYDEASKKYLMTEYDRPMTDGNTGEQLAVKNVLVFFVSYWREYSGASTLLADLTSGGGYYACEGKLIDIGWYRDDNGLAIFRPDGTEIQLAVGHTFVCCPDASSGGLALGW